MEVESRRPNGFGRPCVEGPTVICPLPTFRLLLAAAVMALAALPGRAADDGAAAQGEEPGGEGLALGGGPKRGKVRLRNEAALGALVRITGQDFQWNLPAWRQWLASQELAEPVDLRRGR